MRKATHTLEMRRPPNGQDPGDYEAVEVTGWQGEHPLLFVHRPLYLGPERGWEPGKRSWRVSHIPSGKQVVDYPSRGSALAFCAAVAASGVDWSPSEPTPEMQKSFSEAITAVPGAWR